MKNPKITVFMAAYNVAAFISESISSILNQTFNDFELLIVNDGSTDATVSIVEKFNDSRIRLIHNDGNKGLPITRNRLLALARGEYIAVLDSDDIAYPDRLQAQLEFLNEHSEIALCGGHANIIDENGIVQNRKLIVPTGENVNMALLFQNPFVNSSTMFKANVFRELNGYKDFALSEDFDLFVRISEKYPVTNLDKFLVKYRIHGNNITIKRSDEQYKSEREIIKNMQETLGMPSNSALIDLHMELFTANIHIGNYAKYYPLFKEMKMSNQQSKRYNTDGFNCFLFNKWHEIISLQRTNKHALSSYFKKDLFSWTYFNFKAFRKVFKTSFRGLFN
ncbi:glycosyltransferase [Pedobacter sp. D749]|uniref:glycosyltransferase family 2 protein n=1 Tax=Pedobacter sp. D749 TaxID=2856523 RepID=UPI001C569465|nr:glycosyltransferase [Pedobacter sp. D749]QXU41033.1 glycosyltransferase [Pedobacter sp. D749]